MSTVILTFLFRSMISEIAPDSFHPFRPLSWVLAEGEDASDFLQSQFSNDLSGLNPGDIQYGLWLDQKGKVHGDSCILKSDEERFYLFSYFTQADELIQKLESFIVADDVDLEDQSAQVVGFSLFGDAIARFREIQVEGFADSVCHVLPSRRGVEDSLDVIILLRDRDVFVSKLREKGIVVSVDDNVIELQRMLSKIPRIPEDIGPNELPQEGKLEDTAVSFTKGCYLGQEVMSRLHSMGKVRRSLQLIESKEAIPYGVPLTVEGKKVGVTKTSMQYQMRQIGLALISNTVDPTRPFQIDGIHEGAILNLEDEGSE